MVSKVGSLTIPGAGGNLSVTGVGFQPKVVLFWGNRRTADGASSSGAANSDMEMTILGIGVSSTKRVVLADDDNFTGGNPYIDGTLCISLVGQGTAHCRCTFVSQDADGFTVNVTLLGSYTGGAIINYMALAGSDLSVGFSSGTTPGAPGSVAVTGAGFQPTACIVVSGQGITSLSTGSLGFASSPTDAYSISSCWNSSIGRYARSGKVITEVSGNTKAMEADLTSFDADGGTFNFTTQSGTGRAFYVLWLRGVSAKAGTILQKTSTGSQAYTGFGFQPVATLFASVEKTASTTIDTTLLAWMVGGVDSALNQAVNSMSDNANGVAGLSRTLALRALQDNATPTILAAGSVTTLGSDGFTVNWTTADATAREFGYFALGTTSAGTPAKARPVLVKSQAVQRAVSR